MVAMLSNIPGMAGIVVISGLLCLCSGSIPDGGRQATHEALIYEGAPSNMDVSGIAEALQFTNVTLQVIDTFVRTELPAEAQAEAQRIVAEAEAGLKGCESMLQSILNIWEYKMCCNGQKLKALEGLRMLKEKYRPSGSGAARLRPLLLSWLLLLLWWWP